jgi:hypothetical protein
MAIGCFLRAPSVRQQFGTHVIPSDFLDDKSLQSMPQRRRRRHHAQDQAYERERAQDRKRRSER